MRLLLLFVFAACVSTTQAQYLETFSVPNKGYKTNFLDDLTGVNWSLSNWVVDDVPNNIFGRDASDYFNTTAGGVLQGLDFDQEVCWESPLINISNPGTVSFSLDLSWTGFDADNAGNPCTRFPAIATLDYIRVEYSVDNGPFTLIPNVVGGAACATIGYTTGPPFGPFDGNTTVSKNNITGNTLQIRVCAGMNANAEIITIDNVSVPESGVNIGCAAPVLSTAVVPVGCAGPNTGAIDLSVSAGTPGYTYDWSNDGPENPDNDTQDLSNLSVGTYTVTVTDAASCSATISATVDNSALITLSTATQDASCPGVMDGEIDLVVIF